MVYKKFCKNCDTVYEGHPDSLYCSQACRRKTKKARYRSKNTREFKCEQCGVQFLRNPDRGHVYRFCSQICAGLNNTKPKKEATVYSKVCAICAKYFETARIRQTQCSPDCRVTRVCDLCFKPFETIYPSQKYCSRGCGSAARLPLSGTIYYLKCGEFLKVGYTAKGFEDRLGAIRRGIPYLVEVLMTRGGTLEEEQEFHQAHKDDLAEYGGREWYVDTPEFRREAEEFLMLPVDTNLD